MGNISLPLLLFGGALLLLGVLLSDALRRLAVAAAIIGLLWAGWHVFVRVYTCPRGAACMMPLQPTWAGFCSAGNRAAILKVDGQYFLAAEAGADGQASCVDLRFWQ